MTPGTGRFCAPLMSADVAPISTHTRIQIDWLRQWHRLIAVALIGLGLGLRPAAAQTCVGDCSGTGMVRVTDLVLGVNIALGTDPVSKCPAFDCQHNDMVTVTCLIQGVNNALSGCAGSTITVTGSCAAPGSGSRGLKPCDAGTPITVFRCDDRAQCLHQQGLTMLTATTVASGGGWSVQVPMADASAALIFQASITKAVVYRTLGFGTVGGSLRAGLARDVTFAPADITPVSEAAVELLDSNGFANYSDSGAQEVVTAVEQATADLSFDGLTPAAAVTLALNTASANPTVMMVLQTARNTPTPTQTVQPTPTATPPAGRFVDNGDGTITDTQTGLMWEKKDQGSDLHNLSGFYVWAGDCNGDLGLPCQPDAAAVATCSAATGGAVGCAQCDGTATCDTLGKSTIWQWLNQLNAASFAGHGDWRLPTVGKDGGIVQLETIVDLNASGCGNGFPCVPPAFNTGCTGGCAVTSCSCTQASFYWSATTSATFPGIAWFVDFGSGVVSYEDKDNGNFVRAVRGGS